MASSASQRIRFACEHCDQLLSVGVSRIGRDVDCPQCGEGLTVPDEETAQELLAERKVRKKAAQAAAAASDDPTDFSQFEVYDDETEFVFEHDDDEGYYYGQQVDRDKVAVPRSILYAQGALLAIVAVTAFAFGWFVGAATSRPVAADPEDNTPKVIEGNLTYIDNNDRELPDAGSVVILLPEEARPGDGERIEIVGLGPDEPLPDLEHLGLQQIRALGGAYTRTDTEGRYRTKVGRRGKYFMLLISGNSNRSSGEQLDLEHLAQIGRYFIPARDLLGAHRYRWTQERIGKDKEEDYVFRRG